MLFEEWDWEQYIAVQKEESRAEGREEGRKTGLAEGRKTGLAEGRRTGLLEGEAAMLARLIRTMAKTTKPEEISRATELPLSQILSILHPTA